MCVRFLARFVVVLFFLLSSLQRLSAAETGDLISTSYLGRYSVGALEALNDGFYQLSALGYLIQDVPDAGVRYAVDVYCVEYYTSDFNGALVIGSGLYADPVTNGLEHVVLQRLTPRPASGILRRVRVHHDER